MSIYSNSTDCKLRQLSSRSSPALDFLRSRIKLGEFRIWRRCDYRNLRCPHDRLHSARLSFQIRQILQATRRGASHPQVQWWCSRFNVFHISFDRKRNNPHFHDCFLHNAENNLELDIETEMRGTQRPSDLLVNILLWDHKCSVFTLYSKTFVNFYRPSSSHVEKS